MRGKRTPRRGHRFWLLWGPHPHPRAAMSEPVLRRGREREEEGGRGRKREEEEGRGREREEEGEGGREERRKK